MSAIISLEICEVLHKLLSLIKPKNFREKKELHSLEYF